MLTFSRFREDAAYTYVQLYRMGIIEAVEGSSVITNNDGKFLDTTYEKELLALVPQYLSLLKGLNINTPIVLFLTITGVKGFRIPHRQTFLKSDRFVIDRDDLILPEVFIESYDVDIKGIMRPLFDLVWNACGYERSHNFNEQGQWVSR